MSRNNANRTFLIQTLVFIAQYAADDDFRTLLEMGLSPNQVEIIRSMPVDLITELASCVDTTLFLTIKVDPLAMDMALSILNRRKEDKELTKQLIAAGACYTAMRALTGIPSNEFIGYRRFLGIDNTGVGRTQKPPVEVQQQIWAVWSSSKTDDIRRRYLEVHQATGISVRVLWDLIQEWESTGDIPMPLSESAPTPASALNDKRIPA